MLSKLLNWNSKTAAANQVSVQSKLNRLSKEIKLLKREIELIKETLAK